MLLYDTTTLHFQAEHEDDLRRVGYSKDRRVDPQIVVGLLVDRSGFPLEIGCFEGNTAETTTIVPIIRGFVERHHLEGIPMVVAADAGMLSAANLKALDELELSFMVGSRMTKAPRGFWSPISIGTAMFSPTGRSSTPSHPGTGTASSTTATRPSRSGTPNTIPVRGGRSGRIRPNEHAAIRRPWPPRKPAHGPSSRAPRQAKAAGFVKVRGDDRTVDEASLARAQSLVGLKGYVTNVPVTVIPAAEVIAKYHDLWHVEKSFRCPRATSRLGRCSTGCVTPSKLT